MKKVGDLLRDYLREKGWLTENPYAALFTGWDKMAGQSLAAHAQIRDVKDGFMIVEVDHPGWVQIARLRKASLLKAAREAAPQGVITDIRFVLGSGEK